MQISDPGQGFVALTRAGHLEKHGAGRDTWYSRGWEHGNSVETLRKIVGNLRFYPDIRRFLRSERPVLEQSLGAVRAMQANRKQNFLNSAHRSVFENAASPYRKLFARADIDFIRLEDLVERAGLEGALEELRARDVYIRYEEFKAINAGKSDYTDKFGKDVNFNNPSTRSRLTIRSSGSRSAGTRLFLDMDHIRNTVVNLYPIRRAMFGFEGADAVLYCTALPNATAIVVLAMNNLQGESTAAWFNPIDPASTSLVYRASTRYALAALRLAGARVVGPQHIPLSDVSPVSRFIAERRKGGAKTWFISYATTAVRICAAARENGLDISGTFFTLLGEPVTQAKFDAIRAEGGIPMVNYGSVDVDDIGCPCPRGQGPDDVHLLTDRVALIRHLRRVQPLDVEVNPFLVTTLTPTAPLMLINVETDDYGELSDRPCDCLLGQLGLHRRISKIRSFVKLTTEGVTFAGTDLLEVLEKDLPDRFGGGPTDYQLLEQEGEGGLTQLNLRVNPDVGPIDEQELLRILYSRVSKSGGGGPLFSSIWKAGDAIRVVREKPLETSGGKILSFHTLK